MNEEQIYEAIKSLAQSQGFYGRLLKALTEDMLAHLVAQNFEDTIDMIMFLET